MLLRQSASSFFSLDMLFVPVVWGFIIPLGELLFNRVAQKLTDWENWRTVSARTHTHTQAAPPALPAARSHPLLR